MKIFVVEDQPIELQLAVTVLHAAGHEVERADAAEKAFIDIRSSLPDVILLDLSLPGMDGLALARRLKADPITQAVPIVAVTSYPENFPPAEATAAGCDAYLPKPLNTRTLPAQLAEVIGASVRATDDTSQNPDR